MIKVIKFKDYGWTMTGEECSDKISQRFYWSVYKLNNDNIIVQQRIEDWKKNKIIKIYYYYSYSDHKLKDGTEIKYNFNQDFITLFESAPPYINIKNPKYPEREEIDCIKKFYNSVLLKNPS